VRRRKRRRAKRRAKRRKKGEKKSEEEEKEEEEEQNPNKPHSTILSDMFIYVALHYLPSYLVTFTFFSFYDFLFTSIFLSFTLDEFTTYKLRFYDMILPFF